MKLRSIVMTSLLIVPTACATGGTATREEPVERRHDYTLEVRNQNFNAVTVYLYRRGARTRLGMVDGKTTRTYMFDFGATEVRILMSFLAGGCILTEEMGLVEGDDLLLIVQASDDRRASRERCQG
ncbi:MAG: hypothetical protein O7I93_14575 [Gemmatimonadetes bacterium]|nr:hypothetical protein [Gemmatimonadota bacterium]